jgi:uncharacterized protein
MTSPYIFPDARILLFAKTPQKGQVKTRLQPVLGEQGALDLHTALIRFCWQQLVAGAVAEPELWMSDFNDPEFPKQLSAPYTCCMQQGENLGARMDDAMTRALTRASSVLIVGADCPAVNANYLTLALGKLSEGVPIVLGPAEDGGYVLVGMNRPCLSPPCLSMFRDIAWGTDQVLAQTRIRLQESATQWFELPTCWDVDRPEDLVRLEQLQVGAAEHLRTF